MLSLRSDRVSLVSFAVCLALAGSALSTASQAQPKAGTVTKAEAEACAKLRSDYEDASKELALNKAKGNVDNSAIRATMREAENNNILNQSRMIFDMMKANGCRIPDHIPSASRYGLASITCSAALQKRKADEAYDRYQGRNFVYHGPITECDISEWTPDQE